MPHVFGHTWRSSINHLRTSEKYSYSLVVNYTECRFHKADGEYFNFCITGRKNLRPKPKCKVILITSTRSKGHLPIYSI